VSDTRPTFILSDVPNLFTVFQELTFDLAKMNLKGLAAKGLGKLMGAGRISHTFPGFRPPCTNCPERTMRSSAKCKNSKLPPTTFCARMLLLAFH